MVSSPFFPHKLANGYSNPAGSVVHSVNGTHIKSLRTWSRCCAISRIRSSRSNSTSKGGEALVFLARGDGGGDRGYPDRQRRAGPGLAGHAGGVAGEDAGQHVGSAVPATLASASTSSDTSRASARFMGRPSTGEYGDWRMPSMGNTVASTVRPLASKRSAG